MRCDILSNAGTLYIIHQLIAIKADTQKVVISSKFIMTFVGALYDDELSFRRLVAALRLDCNSF